VNFSLPSFVILVPLAFLLRCCILSFFPFKQFYVSVTERMALIAIDREAFADALGPFPLFPFSDVVDRARGNLYLA
jgi:hypothetical protein